MTTRSSGRSTTRSTGASAPALPDEIQRLAQATANTLAGTVHMVYGYKENKDELETRGRFFLRRPMFECVGGSPVIETVDGKSVITSIVGGKQQRCSVMVMDKTTKKKRRVNLWIKETPLMPEVADVLRSKFLKQVGLTTNKLLKEASEVGVFDKHFHISVAEKDGCISGTVSVHQSSEEREARRSLSPSPQRLDIAQAIEAKRVATPSTAIIAVETNVAPNEVVVNDDGSHPTQE